MYNINVKMFQTENGNSVPTACSEAHTSVIHFTFSRVLLKEMMLRSCIHYCSLVSASFAKI